MLFRYPGGKQKLSEAIVDWLEEYCIQTPTEYRECFFGAGAIAFELLKRDKKKLIPRLWFNDYDPAIAAVWYSVYKDPQGLSKRFHLFDQKMRSQKDYVNKCWDVTVSDGGRSSYTVAKWFRKWQEELNKLEPGIALPESMRTTIAFKKVAVHQMSFSGLGPVKGCGPIGGDSQKDKNGKDAKWGVGCRYNPVTLEKNVGIAFGLMDGHDLHENVCTCGDWESLFLDDNDAVFYIDPPYCGVGPRLYQHGFDKAKHEKLRDRLLSEDRPWLLSIDNSPEVDNLYQDKKFNKLALPLTYSMAWHHNHKDETTGKKKAKARTEYVISNKPLDVFEDWIAKQKEKKVGKEQVIQDEAA